MSNGFWGSRFPVGNFCFTRLLFLGVAWRLFSRRLHNKVRNMLAPRSVKLVNDDSTASALEHFLADGYDRLNIGGGYKNLEEFINLDFVRHPNVTREVCANILDLTFIPSGRIAQVHSNHLLEHLTYEQIQSQLFEYYRILRPGGILSLRCPNALGTAYAFWHDPIYEEDRTFFVALGYPSEETFGTPLDGWLHKDLYGLLHWFYGDVGNAENQHLSRLTPTNLKKLVEGVGFEILRMTAPESLNLVLIAQKPAN